MKVNTRLLLAIAIMCMLGVFATQAINGEEQHSGLPNDLSSMLFINEIMASNSRTLSDDEGDYPDWIEIYNAGNEPVNLEGCWLSDSKKTMKWQFPKVSIDAGEYLLVWASGKDRVGKRGELHTNFKVSASGESLVLTDSQENIMDLVPPVAIPRDVSYGRYPDTSDNWYFFPRPIATPGAPNYDSGGEQELLGFSEPGGFYTKALRLELTTNIPGAEIFYTLDGSEPDPENTGGKTYYIKQDYRQGRLERKTYETRIYSEPIRINSSRVANRLSGSDRIFLIRSTSHHFHRPSEEMLKATVVRARIRVNGVLSDIITHTYFVDPDIHKRFELPVISISTNPDGLFDFDKGIYVPGATFTGWDRTGNYFQKGRREVDLTGAKVKRKTKDKIAIPLVAHSFDKGLQVEITGTKYYDGKYIVDGLTTLDELVIQAPYKAETFGEGAKAISNWERPIHFEFFEPDGQLGFALNAGLRIHGGYTRSLAHKSLRIYARSDYDTKSVINYEVFPGRTQFGNGESLTTYKRLILRNSGNDCFSTLMKDGMIQTLTQHLKLDTQGFRPAIVFINGEYWGIHNIRERYDDWYYYHHYGINRGELDMLEPELNHEQIPNWKPNNHIASHGDNLGYYAMLEFLGDPMTSKINHDLGDPSPVVVNGIEYPSAFDYIKTQIDIENFIDYNVVQIYVGNTDWPGNNNIYWRKRTDQYEPDAPYGHDGRWRWSLFDTEFGFSNASFDMVYFATTPNGGGHANPPWATFLLRMLLRNQEFKNDFINAFADNMNTTFDPKHVDSVVDELSRMIVSEVPEHRNRWGTLGNWYNDVNVMKQFARQRLGYMKRHLMMHFKLSGTARVTLNSDTTKGTIRINSLNICDTTPGAEDPESWTGTYFKGIPIRITAVPEPGYRFVRWEETGDSTEALTLTLSGDATMTAVFEPLPR